jgi:F1F0 ATPase subunit 2
MSDPRGILVALVVGVAIGALFFTGLWWTVQRAFRSPRPALWFGVSLLVRTAVTACGLLWAARGSWQRATACMVGFIAARVFVTWLTRPSRTARRLLRREAQSAH